MGIFKAVAGMLGGGSQHDINDPKQWESGRGSLPWLSSAGARVTPGTSMSLSAYYGCIRNISEDIAKLDCGAFRKLPSGGKELAEASPAHQIFTVSPNEEMIPSTLKQTIMSQALGWGNGYAELQRNGRGDVIAIHPIHPTRVSVERAEDGSIYYRVFKVPFDQNPLLRGRGEYVDMSPRDIFHILGLGGDGLVGYSVAKFAQASLGTALATQTYGATFFGNGTHLGGVLEHPASLSKEAQERLLESWNKKNQGSDNAHKTNILEEGMKWQQTSVPPKDAQFLEVRQFQVVDIARWFRMPPHKIQSLEGAKFNNIEHQSIEYVQDTLLPWMVKFQEEVKRKIITQSNVHFKFNAKNLLMADAKSRSEYYRTMINAGTMQPNEAREAEDLNPGPAQLDKFYMQSGMTTLDAIVDQNNLKTDKEVKGKPSEDAMAQALSPVLRSAIDRIEGKEIKALARQEKKGPDPEWAKAFFDEQNSMAFSNLSAVLSSYGNAKGWDQIQHAEAIGALQGNLSIAYEKRKSSYPNTDKEASLEMAFDLAIQGGNNAKS